jgi:hypothetical protein
MRPQFARAATHLLLAATRAGPKTLPLALLLRGAKTGRQTFSGGVVRVLLPRLLLLTAEAPDRAVRHRTHVLRRPGPRCDINTPPCTHLMLCAVCIVCAVCGRRPTAVADGGVRVFVSRQL